jgi:hypothetical protein
LPLPAPPPEQPASTSDVAAVAANKKIFLNTVLLLWRAA